MDNRIYDYYAFISYKRADYKWAKWIRERLQSYRLPYSTCRRYKGMLARRFNPVFLDKTNLTPGMLEEGLRSEVQSSKYLIVICSHAAREDSKYLDEEIQFFLDGGGDISRIIPFIVDEYNDPVNDTFPLRLQKACEESSEEVFCIDAVSLGRKNAFMELVAYMHGLTSAEIKRDDLKRSVLRTAASTAMIAALVSGSLYARYRYVDYHSEKAAYYIDYIERYGVAEGIGELTEKQVKHMYEHYAIISSEGKVRQLRHENSYGRLIDYDDTLHSDRPAAITYEYTNGMLDKAIYIDIEENPTVILDYTDETLKTANLTQYTDSEGNGYVGAAFLTAHSSSEVDKFSQDAGSARSNTVRYLFEYDEDGYVTEMRFASDMRHNYVATDADGIAGIRYIRDDKGRKISERYLYFEGSENNAANKDSYSTRSNFAGIYEISFSYNDKGNMSGAKFLDPEGNLINCPGGPAYIVNEYDETGNLNKTSGFGTDGRPIVSTSGFAAVGYEYDERGDMSKVSFYGPDGKPIISDNGFACMAKEYDKQGYLIKESYYGTDGGPVLDDSGVACRENEYDGHHNKIKQSYYGTDGKPVMSIESYASCESEYNERGEVIRESYLGTDGRPVLNDSWYAALELEYDKKGNVIRQSYYGVDGEPVISYYGYAGVLIEYDERGNEISTTTVGTDGKPILSGSGQAVTRKEYNERGNETRVSFYGTTDDPILTKHGYSSAEFEYDERGNNIKISYYGVDGQLILRDGFAVVKFSFDECGNRTGSDFYDLNGKPALCGLEYSSDRFEYDECGRRIKERYLGTDGKPILREGGYASVEDEYDERGNMIKQSYFGPDGRPVMLTGGYSEYALEYDDNGRITKQNQALMDGYACLEWEYDERGDIITERTLDANGKPVVTNLGYAIREASYDVCGNLTEERLFGSNGEPILNDVGFSVLRMEYDERGNIIRESYYGTKGEPVMIDDGYTCVEWEYNERDEKIGETCYNLSGQPVVFYY
ncbi:MAG: toll/interleukin-1 receptor domain-containing protein [Lachnospiraceae bacterium]|nr:toll/interleukin-1 receptor domain-containing protein [Lachnospiraceae bacterium]